MSLCTAPVALVSSADNRVGRRTVMHHGRLAGRKASYHHVLAYHQRELLRQGHRNLIKVIDLQLSRHSTDIHAITTVPCFLKILPA